MIRKMYKKDAIRVAGIHQRELSGFLPELGIEFLQAFYETSLNIPEMFTYIHLQNEQISGFVSGINTVNGLNKRLISRNPKAFILPLLRFFLTHPMRTVKLVKTFSYPGFTGDIPELLSIAVDGRWQRRGIGKKLFFTTVDEFKKRGIKKFRISVYDRLSANEFYRKIGCRFETSFTFLGEKMNYYLYKI
ncbi:GNAT family N-acetyltransferase [Patescibacteria group bacterium]|nr:GNAT family N-acetyltransferase [Patescibacteria group bacterium]